MAIRFFEKIWSEQPGLIPWLRDSTQNWDNHCLNGARLCGIVKPCNSGTAIARSESPGQRETIV
jgi:hypothetical protein